MDRLRIRNDKDVVWEDASEDMLRSLLVQLLQPGQFLIVDRGADRAEEGFAQTIVTDDRSLVVEYRDGAEAEQWAALAPDVTTTQNVLAGWAFGRPGWREPLAWNPIDIPAASDSVAFASGGPMSANDAIAVKQMGSDPGMAQAIALPALLTSLLGIPVALVIGVFAGNLDIGFWTAVAGYTVGVVLPLIAMMVAPVTVLTRITPNALLRVMLVAPPLITAVSILAIAAFLR